jgi:hypothetical protein
VRAVPRLCEFYPGICLTTEEKAPLCCGCLSDLIANLKTVAADSATMVNDLAIRTKKDFVKTTRRS